MRGFPAGAWRLRRVATAAIEAALLSLAILFLTATSAALAAVLIEIDKSAQEMTVASDGRLLWRWPVSTGRAGRDTPNGSFRAFRMEEDHYSEEWDNAPMPHSIFFTKRGHAIHGYHDTKNLGRPASAGCVRLHPDHAKQLFALVKDQGVLNTTVVLTGIAPTRDAPAVARRGRGLLPGEDAASGLPPPVDLAPGSRAARERYLQYDYYGRPIDPRADRQYDARYRRYDYYGRPIDPRYGAVQPSDPRSLYDERDIARPRQRAPFPFFFFERY
jgi:hypothetical protein